ncbi:effector-associated constant component EACC1 [Novosphingobium sp.]|uniref:effector-associated constant component EACC1 n=1 Tax=Novosphingobium sp. TaxID=1874826 RepID=UPI003D6D0873
MELDDLTGQLRRRLLEFDVETVGPVSRREVPAEAKPADAVIIGALVVTLAPVALSGVVGVVQTWLQNRPVRGVKMTIDGRSLELTNPSRADQHQLVQAFLDGHAQQ